MWKSFMNTCPKWTILYIKSYAHRDCVGKPKDDDTTRSMSQHLMKCISYNTKKNKAIMIDLADHMEASQTIFDDYESLLSKVNCFRQQIINQLI